MTKKVSIENKTRKTNVAFLFVFFVSIATNPIFSFDFYQDRKFNTTRLVVRFLNELFDAFVFLESKRKTLIQRKIEAVEVQEILCFSYVNGKMKFHWIFMTTSEQRQSHHFKTIFIMREQFNATVTKDSIFPSCRTKSQTWMNHQNAS